jgi:dihydroxyacetone kinase-like predicted kinase
MVASYQQPPTASDFIEAFSKSVPGVILVFPNNKNTELAALQAQRMYENAQVFVIKTRSDAECYAALPMIDFTCENMEELLPQIEEVIGNVTVVTMTQASKNACIDNVAVQCGDFVATIDRRVLASGTSLDAVAGQAIGKVMDENEFEVVTAFVNPSVSDGIKDGITRFVADNFKYTEVTVIDTDDVFYQIILSFE